MIHWGTFDITTDELWCVVQHGTPVLHFSILFFFSFEVLCNYVNTIHNMFTNRTVKQVHRPSSTTYRGAILATLKTTAGRESRISVECCTLVVFYTYTQILQSLCIYYYNGRVPHHECRLSNKSRAASRGKRCRLIAVLNVKMVSNNDYRLGLGGRYECNNVIIAALQHSVTLENNKTLSESKRLRREYCSRL